jgi:hypothetical protein
MSFLICEKCEEKVKRWGDSVAEHYRILCEFFSHTENPIAIEFGPTLVVMIKSMELLERKGAVITHETLSEIWAKPAYFYKTTHRDYGTTMYLFCVEPGHVQFVP